MENPAGAGPDNTQDMELRRFTTSRGAEGSYVLGRFLSIQQIALLLQNRTPLNESEAKLLETLEWVKSHHFPHTQVPLPVSSLQHVTEEDALNDILEQECFRITRRARSDQRPEFCDLLFLSAGISQEDTEVAREQMYEGVRRVITPRDARTYQEKIKEQFATSPAFSEYSHYGNFRFSFALSYLLDKYKAQHCDGKEPQLRILGTEVYQQEIAHYIVVHSPSTNKYDDLPIVLTTQSSSSEPPPSVYRDGETLYWSPESTSEELIMKISEDGKVQRECYKQCDSFREYGGCCHSFYTAWNHLIFAFHLPNGRQLKIPRNKFLYCLNTCVPDKPYLGENRLKRQKAEEVVEMLLGEISDEEEPI